MGITIKRVISRVRRFRREWREREWERLRRSGKWVRRGLGGGLVIDLPSESELARMIFVGDLEGEEQNIFRSLLRPGDFVLDVGANFGIYTVNAAGVVGDAGKIWAFEPTSGTFQSLQHNIAVNHLTDVVVAHKVALSDSDGSGELRVSRGGHDAWNTLGAVLHEKGYETEAVQCLRLDSALAKQSSYLAPSMLKLDVEGWEWHVLRGAEQLLGRPDAPMLQVEFAPTYFEANGTTIQILGDEIMRHGYALFKVVDAKTLQPIEGAFDQLTGNLYAVKPGSPWEERVRAICLP
jgi:FkbM family methyltransferase